MSIFPAYFTFAVSSGDIQRKQAGNTGGNNPRLADGLIVRIRGVGECLLSVHSLVIANQQILHTKVSVSIGWF
jgi:hypothetical protein